MLSPDEIATLIQDLVREFGLAPELINEGECECFARQLSRYLPGSKVCWPEDEHLAYVHAYVKYNNMYYDSEAPYGKDDWMDLPCFKRFFDDNPELHKCLK